MNEPLTSCSHAHNWYINNPLSYYSSIINRRLDLERDLRYWSGDWYDDDDECYHDEMKSVVVDEDPIENLQDIINEPESPMTPKQRGVASKRRRVKLTKGGGANFDWD